jgi:hypothetical protein
MTTSRIKRCNHCNNVYVYYPSSYGFHPEQNDDRYCPQCMMLIEAALREVPVLFKKRWIDCPDYTFEQIQTAQNKRMGITGPVKRIMFSNADADVCEKMPDPAYPGFSPYYHASYFKSRPDEVKVMKEIWWDEAKNQRAEDQHDY